jgi:hypothetical protein
MLYATNHIIAVNQKQVEDRIDVFFHSERMKFILDSIVSSDIDKPPLSIEIKREFHSNGDNISIS